MASGHALNPRRQDMAIIERRDAVVELRRQRPRPSWRTIGEQLGITAATARTDYLEAMMLTTEHTAELADVERVEQLEMTDKLIDRLTPLIFDERPAAKDGRDMGPSLEATDRLIRVLDHRAKITGIYAPTKVAPTDPTGQHAYVSASDDTIRRLAQELAKSRTPVTPDAAGDRGTGGATALDVGGEGAGQPITAAWELADVAAASGSSVWEDEDGG